MKLPFLAVLGAAGLLLAACSEDRKTETTAAAPAPTAAGPVRLVPTDASPIPTVYPSAADTIGFRGEARHLAGRVAGDLKLTDGPTRRRLENAYFARRQRLAGLKSRYAADTAGRYAAVRALNDATDRNVRRLLPTPALVRTYESRRADYYDGPLTAPAAEAAVSAQAAAAGVAAPVRAGRRSPRIVKYKQNGRITKIKYSNGTIVKIDKDGDRKIKYANGRKVKVDAADGPRKAKAAGKPSKRKGKK